MATETVQIALDRSWKLISSAVGGEIVARTLSRFDAQFYVGPNAPSATELNRRATSTLRLAVQVDKVWARSSRAPSDMLQVTRVVDAGNPALPVPQPVSLSNASVAAGAEPLSPIGQFLGLVEGDEIIDISPNDGRVLLSADRTSLLVGRSSLADGSLDVSIRIRNSLVEPNRWTVTLPITVAAGVVAPVYPPITIDAAPNAIAGKFYAYVPSVSGGVGAKTFRLIGSLPPGMSFASANGAITGTPQGLADVDVALGITSSNGKEEQVRVSFKIVAPPPLALPTTPLLVPVEPPAGFGWNFFTQPIRVFKDGPRHFTTDLDLKTKVSSDIWNGPVYYVSTSGNNNNNGTSITTPVRSLWKARQLLQASPFPAGIIMMMGDASGITVWDRNNDFNDTGGAGGGGSVKPTKPFALMGFGGRHIMGPISPALAWTYDDATKTWAATRSNVASMIDLSLFNDLGLLTRMPRIAAGSGSDAAARLAATRALVGAQQGVYAQSDNSVVVRMLRDAVPNDSTVRVILTLADAFNAGAVDGYVSGLTLLGSHVTGVAAVYDQGARNFVMEDCTLGLGGSDGAIARSSFQADFITGFIGLRGVKAFSSFNDHFNAHANNGNLHLLMVDCEGFDAGRDGASPASQSNQVVTLHEDVKAISLNTKGRLASGGVVRNVNTSQHWDLGGDYADDRGDTRFGGTQVSAGVVMNDTAKYWGDCITVRGCAQTFLATANAEIRLRDPIEIGGRRSGTGLIGAY